MWPFPLHHRSLHNASISTWLVSDPLPLRGSPPLQGGDWNPLMRNGFSVPLTKGDRREAAGGRSQAMLKSMRCTEPHHCNEGMTPYSVRFVHTFFSPRSGRANCYI